MQRLDVVVLRGCWRLHPSAGLVTSSVFSEGISCNVAVDISTVFQLTTVMPQQTQSMRTPITMQIQKYLVLVLLVLVGIWRLPIKMRARLGLRNWKQCSYNPLVQLQALRKQLSTQLRQLKGSSPRRERCRRLPIKRPKGSSKQQLLTQQRKPPSFTPASTRIHTLTPIQAA